MKTCSRCKIEKDNKCFSKDNSRKDKLNCYCKECLSTMRKEYFINRKRNKKKENIKSKVCKICGQEKEAKFFYFDRYNNCYKSYCVKCDSAYKRENAVKNYIKKRKEGLI